MPETSLSQRRCLLSDRVLIGVRRNTSVETCATNRFTLRLFISFNRCPIEEVTDRCPVLLLSAPPPRWMETYDRFRVIRRGTGQSGTPNCLIIYSGKCGVPKSVVVWRGKKGYQSPDLIPRS